MAAAVSELRRTGLVTVDDSMLEHLLAPWLESREEIGAVAVYGFDCSLRIIAQVEVVKAEAELLVELRPEPPVWVKGTHLLEFSYSVLSVEHTNRGVQIAKSVASEALGFIGPCVGLLASCLMNKVSHSFGRARFADVIDLGVDGISVGKDRITVDLDAIPETRRLLWYKPEISESHPKLLGLAARHVGLEGACLGDLFDLKGITMGREGVTLDLDISNKGKAALDEAETLWSDTRELGSKALGALSGWLGRDKDKGKGEQENP